MPLYTKKPVTISAVQWTGTQASTREVLELMGQTVDTPSTVAQEKFHDYCDMVREKGLTIHTLEGDMTASVGDYIIKGVKGEVYPCKPDIFELTYDKVEANEHD